MCYLVPSPCFAIAHGISSTNKFCHVSTSREDPSWLMKAKTNELLFVIHAALKGSCHLPDSQQKTCRGIIRGVVFCCDSVCQEKESARRKEDHVVVLRPKELQAVSPIQQLVRNTKTLTSYLIV